MARSFSNLPSSASGGTHSIHAVREAPDLARIGVPAAGKILLSPREAEQTQRNRLAFIALAILGIVLAAGLSLML